MDFPRNPRIERLQPVLFRPGISAIARPLPPELIQVIQQATQKCCPQFLLCFYGNMTGQEVIRCFKLIDDHMTRVFQQAGLCMGQKRG